MGMGKLIWFIIVTAITALVLSSTIRDLLLPFHDKEIDVKGKNVIVTGASTGIGEQVAYRYAERGANIVITSRREKSLQKVAAKCRELGSPSVAVLAADMGQPEQVDTFATKVLKHFNGRLDQVVLNHIGPMTYTFYQYDVEFARWLTQVNYLSYVQLASTFIPHMEQSGGSLVVVSSVAGRITTPFVAPYAASKFALEGFFGSMRHELEMLKSNVTISILPFGLIGTDSARTATNGKVLGIDYESPAEAGLAVVRVATHRPVDYFWPWWTRIIVLLRHTVPDLLKLTEPLQFNMENFKDDIEKVKLISRNKVLSFAQKGK